MNTSEGTDDWHKCMYNTQGAYQRLTTMHTPMNVRHAATRIQPPPPPYSVPRVG